MSHCHNEHVVNGGGHGHGHHNHEHDHTDDITPALQHSLYQHIDFSQIVTLNEARRDSGKAIVQKTWAERQNRDPELESSIDEQLLMDVPFTGQVKLHSILIRAPQDSSAPRTLRVFINQKDIDFNSIPSKPTQEFELSQTSEIQELPVKRAKFNNVQRLTLFIVDNFATNARDSDVESSEETHYDDAEITRLNYIGFKGEWMQLGRAPTHILYEAAPNPNDHAIKGSEVNSMGYTIKRRP